MTARPVVSFDDAVALVPEGEGRFIATTPSSWMASGRAPGGLVEAQLFSGLAATVEDGDMQPLSFTAHLLRAPGEGEYQVRTEVLRRGRTLTSLSGQIVQDNKVIATALASFGTPRPSPEFDEMPMPNVEPPTSDRLMNGYVPEFALPYGDNIILQDRLGPRPFEGRDGPMERVGWAGFKVPRPVDGPGLVMVCDIGMMAWWVRLDKMLTTVTLDHTTHFRANLAAVAAYDLVLMSSRTGLVRNGYLDWDIDVWAADGTLLCQSRQLLAVLS